MDGVDALLLIYAAIQLVSVVFDIAVISTITVAVYGSSCNGWPSSFGNCRIETFSKWDYNSFCPIEGRIGFKKNGNFYFLTEVNEPCVFPIVTYTIAAVAHLLQIVGILIVRYKYGKTFKDAISWVLIAGAASFLCCVLEVIPAITVSNIMPELCKALDVPLCKSSKEAYKPSKFNCNPSDKALPKCQDFGGNSFVGQWQTAIGLMWTAVALVLVQFLFATFCMCRRLNQDGRLPKTFSSDDAKPRDTFAKKMRESQRKLVRKQDSMEKQHEIAVAYGQQQDYGGWPQEPERQQYWQGGDIGSDYFGSSAPPSAPGSFIEQKQPIQNEPNAYQKQFQSRMPHQKQLEEDYYARIQGHANPPDSLKYVDQYQAQAMLTPDDIRVETAPAIRASGGYAAYQAAAENRQQPAMPGYSSTQI